MYVYNKNLQENILVCTCVRSVPPEPHPILIKYAVESYLTLSKDPQ